MKPLDRTVASAVFAAVLLAANSGAKADPGALPENAYVPKRHSIGEVFEYNLRGTLSQAIVGRDPFGHSIAQQAASTDVVGRERVAIKAVSDRGLSLHRTGTITATFKGKSSSAQPGSGWTLVTHDGKVNDRKGSTLGGLFLLPLAFLGDRAVESGTALHIGDRWRAKLGVALFGMVAEPMMRYDVTGTRKVLGVSVYTLSASGSAPIREPVVTNDDAALGNASGTAHLTMQCDYDPVSRRMVSMQLDLVDDLHLQSSGRQRGRVRDRQHYLVALDARSMQAVAAPAQGDPATELHPATAPPY